ncbi:threonine-phosphate decarboxylase CobD [Roseibaca sp. Y0-43]|uniref:threonine-phosphate decarboxylase CobD n=1 Tax=Roseibaca sp. Y0-43 TaxID=2816854 RepID=UPI001D0C24C7|nr:threonine-phosphate decarboxylase CobD [Roseibaca sp. Y0-43]MCC1482674.1 threonine-phosphate decarboxylase [Roseibaca sp. Y0-43]
MRDHGGDLDRAMQRYGSGSWVDLSTGINPQPYPVGPVPARAWASLPTATDIAGLEDAAARLYATAGSVVVLGGAQAAIQLVPRLRAPGRACVVGPTYNEHAAALQAQGWTVSQVSEPADAVGADLLTVVNPNNPDGRMWSPQSLRAVQDHVGLLVVDESFADTESGLSLAPQITPDTSRMVVLRSFGKFFGLAGLRLGFALTGDALAQRLRALAGPWAVNGPAIALATTAMADTVWQDRARVRLRQDAARLDDLAAAAGWRLVGGTPLFRTYATPDAAKARDSLARHHVWARLFPYSDSWLRLGLPGTAMDWAQVEQAFAAV